MRSRALERLDDSARRVLAEAGREATRFGNRAVGTEDVLVALAMSNAVTARLLAEGGCDVTMLRDTYAALRPGRSLGEKALLATLGVDLAEVRRRAERSFGQAAVAQATSRSRPRQLRVPLRARVSCGGPLPVRRRSLLVGEELDVIPRVERLVKRAARDARPRPASAVHLLAALIAGREPACELLDAMGVDPERLTTATRRSIEAPADSGTGQAS